jgi:hypothetical protein
MGRIALAALIGAALAGCSDDEPYGLPDPTHDGPTVLFDHYHARKQNHVDYQLDKGVYTYQGAFGFSRFVEHIERNNYAWEEIRTMPLSAERLANFDILFINLVSNDYPDFTEDEVAAIIEFVDNGGGLFVVADHTNVYDHGERVNKFLVPMGVEVLFHTAADRPPEHSVAGLGWILVDDLKDHPVMADVEQISLQTGGPQRADNPDYEVAFTSDQSWGDLWNKDSGLGYYGDWQYVEGEDLAGPLNVHIAAEYGEGRIVVCGDQNMFGDPWLNFVDNFQLAMNSMEWLAQEDGTGSPLRSNDVPGLEIAVDQKHNGYAAGNLGNGNGYFAYFVNSNRDRLTTSKGSLRYTDEEVIKIMDPDVAFEPSEIADLQQRLQDGTTVVVGFEPTTVDQVAWDLLADLAPDFSITIDGNTYGTEQFEELDALEITLEEAAYPASSPVMNISDLELSAWTQSPTAPPPENMTPEPGTPRNPNAKRYMIPVTSTWGDPFIDAGQYTIARKKTVGNGELIIIVQDGVFRTKTLGGYLTPPDEFNEDMHELHFRFLEYLRAFHGTDPADQ